jgi:hypothetical protein
MKRISLLALSFALTALSLGSVAEAAGRSSPAAALAAVEPAPQGDSETYFFDDVLKPHGKARGVEERHADGRACGVSANQDMPSDIPAFEKCMKARGWKFDHIVTTHAPEPYVPPGSVGIWTYDDVLKPHGRVRGEREEQIATRACDAGDSDRIGSATFRSCMNSRGWRLSQFDPAPSDSNDDSAPEEASPAYDATADTLQFVEEQRAIEQSNEAAQQMANDALAAAAQNAANAWVAQQ